MSQFLTQKRHGYQVQDFLLQVQLWINILDGSVAELSTGAEQKGVGQAKRERGTYKLSTVSVLVKYSSLVLKLIPHHPLFLSLARFTEKFWCTKLILEETQQETLFHGCTINATIPIGLRASWAMYETSFGKLNLTQGRNAQDRKAD